MAPLYFLLGELPLEAQIHRDIFSLFYNVWSNPDSKIHEIIKYLLQSSNPKSRTWSIHLRNLAQKYNLNDPLECLLTDAPSKSSFKELILTKISAHYEKDLRNKAKENSRMNFLNVSLMSLRGRCHNALSNIVTSHEVKKSRIHIKMLCGDFLTYEVKSAQSGGTPFCRLCPEKKISENIPHILICCEAYSEIRNRILPQLENMIGKGKSNIDFKELQSNAESLTHFILDPTSINLENRISETDPDLPDIFRLSRDFCHAIGSERAKLLKKLVID